MAPRRNYLESEPKRYYSNRHTKDSIKINDSCGNSPAVWNRKNRLHQVQSREEKLNITKLVYKFLGNVASLETAGSHQETSMCPTESKHRRGGKKSKKQKVRPRSNSSRNPTDGNQDSRTFVTYARSATTNSTICTAPSTPASTASGIGTGRKFSIQAIKDYIRAGIAEGKRRAKRYMCKALSFGVDTGYLIPTDSDGQVLRVSSALVSFNAQKDEGERGMRQKLRRGNATCTSEERRLLRRRDGVVPRKRTRSPSSVPSSASSSKRSRANTKKPKYSKRIRKHKSKKGRKTKSKRRPGRPKSRINSTKIKAEKSSQNLKGKTRAEVDRAAEENVREETLTPLRSEEDNEKSIKEKKLSDPLIEENSSEVTELKEK